MTNNKPIVVLKTPTRDNYVGAVYGSAALASVAEAVMLDSFDELEEKTDYPQRRAVHDRMKAAEILMHDTLRTICEQLKHKEDSAWMADYSNAVRETIAADVQKLRFAIANRLGRLRGLQSPSSVALLLVAQSLAAEAADFAERRAEMFRGYQTANRHGSMVSASNMIRAFSCRMTEQQLRWLARMIVEPVANDDLDLPADTQVSNGVKIILERLADIDTWKYAVEKANSLNGKKLKRNGDAD